MELCFVMDGLYFCFMLDACSYAAFIINVGIRLSNESCIGLLKPMWLCHTSCKVSEFDYPKRDSRLAVRLKFNFCS